MLKKKPNRDEIKLIRLQPFNVVSWLNPYFDSLCIWSLALCKVSLNSVVWIETHQIIQSSVVDKSISILRFSIKKYGCLPLPTDSTSLKFSGEVEWKCKKHQPEYRRQWRKLHICIDAKTLQIGAVQFTTNNVSDSQVLVFCWIKSHLLILSIRMEHMTRNCADKWFQIVMHIP